MVHVLCSFLSTDSLFCMVIGFCQGNPFWKLVRNVLKTPGQEQVDCQKPKPILLDTGEMKQPYDWAVGCNYLTYFHLTMMLQDMELVKWLVRYSISFKLFKTLFNCVALSFILECSCSGPSK